MSSGRGALEGIRVLDVTQVMAGPFCAMQLCDMGADVIKVEPPVGDSTRRMASVGPAFGEGLGVATGHESPAFNAVNRGKRGIVLDLRTSRGCDVFRRLVARTDILIENSRPGVMRRLGLDYASLAADHPALIYASISGYGQTGPDATKGGLDLIAQGVSGLMSVTGDPGGSPVKIGVPITDLGAALYTVSAILAALHYRTRTGHGQYVDTSLVEAGIAFSVWESAEYFASGVRPEPLGTAHRLVAPYQAIRCADGHITIGASTNALFRRLCDVLGHPEWTSEPDFADNTMRVRHRIALAARIESITCRQPCHEWVARLDTAGVPCGPINDYRSAFDDPQVRARGMIVNVDHPTLGAMRTLGSPIKMSETPPVVDRRAPLLGEHTRQVLREAGCSESEIDAVIAECGR